jgi:hypothetical protein
LSKIGKKNWGIFYNVRLKHNLLFVVYFNNKSVCVCVSACVCVCLRVCVCVCVCVVCVTCRAHCCAWMTENPPCTCVWWVAYFKELPFTRVCHFLNTRIGSAKTLLCESSCNRQAYYNACRVIEWIYNTTPAAHINNNNNNIYLTAVGLSPGGSGF